MSEQQNIQSLEALAAQAKKEDAEKQRAYEEAKKQKEKNEQKEVSPYADMDVYEMFFKIGRGEITDPAALPVYLEKSRESEKSIVQQALGKYPEEQAFIQKILGMIDAKYDALRDGGAAAQAKYCSEWGTRAANSQVSPDAQAEATAWYAMAGRLMAETPPAPQQEVVQPPTPPANAAGDI